MNTQAVATIEDLYKVKGKAEIVGGKLVVLPLLGCLPSQAKGEIYASLGDYEDQVGGGRMIPGNAAYIVDLPNRTSFCPDVSFFTGKPAGMKFLEGAPVFAVEIRVKESYGTEADRQIAAKRDDYFAAGTQVVWDVDLLGDAVIKSYAATDPNNPRLFRRGEIADAEPAVPGWRMAVDDLFA
jgi:Uma2 family endonuclease